MFAIPVLAGLIYLLEEVQGAMKIAKLLSNM
jgi:hypothetical protein